MQIDHLVWYTADLAEGRRYFQDRMDVAPLYGGEHPGEGTANAVVSLGPAAYLEILGRDEMQNGQGLAPELTSLKGHGLYHWAVSGIELDRLADRASKAGLEGGQLVSGGRLKPDGKRLNWRCWGLCNHGFGSLVPFFIDWRDSEHPARSAPLGGSLETFEVHTPDASRLQKIFTVLDLDIAVKEDTEHRVSVLLRSSKGTTKLSSFFPIPRGYVI